MMLVGLIGCGRIANTPEAAQLTPLTVQLSWSHSAQFAGLYAAQELGYYADEGLDVTLLEGGIAKDRITPVVDGTAQLGFIGPPPLIMARAEGKPLRAVAAIYQHSPFVFFSLAESGINRPQDFAGKRIQVGMNARPVLHSLTGRVGLDPDQYEEVVEARFSDLYNGNVDVASGFLTNEVLQAEAAGYRLQIIYPDDYGIHTYNDVLFSNDTFLNEHPELVEGFLRATIRGWITVIEEPERVGELVPLYKTDADPNWEIRIMRAATPLIFTGKDPIGSMSPAVWEQTINILRDQRVLTKPLNAADIYTLRFIDR